MRLFLFLILSVNILLFSSCAPSALGTGSSNPYELGGSRLVNVSAGETWFVADRGYSYEFLDIDSDNFYRIFPINSDKEKAGDSFSKSVNWLSIREKEMPEGWDLSFADVRAQRTVTRVEDNGTVWSYLEVDVIYKINIPVDTEPGRYLVNVTARSISGVSKKFVLRFEVSS